MAASSSAIPRASIMRTPALLRASARNFRLASWVRPDSTSLPMISTAAATESFLARDDFRAGFFRGPFAAGAFRFAGRFFAALFFGSGRDVVFFAMAVADLGLASLD